MRTVLAAIALVALTSSSLACSFNTDCSPGSRCLKRSGSIYGVCIGGMFPGNSNDDEPVTELVDPRSSYGNTCSFNTDCDPGQMCVKESGRIDGVCIGRR